VGDTLREIVGRCKGYGLQALNDDGFPRGRLLCRKVRPLGLDRISRMKTENPIRRPLRLSRGSENRPLVLLQDSQTVAHVVGVVWNIARQIELKPEERAGCFRDEFFEGIGLRSETA
jgi:hypothetical protein